MNSVIDDFIEELEGGALVGGLKPCPPGKSRNRVTRRCRDKKSAREAYAMKSKKNSKKTSKTKKASKRIAKGTCSGRRKVGCKRTQYCNWENSRCKPKNVIDLTGESKIITIDGGKRRRRYNSRR